MNIFDVQVVNETFIAACSDTVMLIDTDGTVIWYTSNSDIGWHYLKFQSIIHVPGEGFVSTGVGKYLPSSSFSLFITLLDFNGNPVWIKNYDYPGTTDYGFDIIQLDAGYAIAARKGGDAWILRTDSQGDTLWTREWGWNYNDKAVSILHVDNSLTVLMHGSTSSTPGGPHIVRYDLDGNLLWETDIPELAGEFGQDMCEASDNGLFILDSHVPYIAHTDYSGNYQWHFQPPGWGDNWGWSISTTMDGGIIFGGENAYFQPSQAKTDLSGMISRHDSQGNELWRDYVYNSGCTALYSVRQLSQGGYIAAGEAFSSQSGVQGILIKYAPETGIESGNIDPTVNIGKLSPNPFSTTLDITYSLPVQTDATITVHDLSGRIVDVIDQGLFSEGQHTIQWIPNGISSGFYLVRLSSTSGSVTRNVMFLR